MRRIIETERLVLRPLELADAPMIARLIGEWGVIRWLTMPPWPYRLEDAEWFIGDEVSNGAYGIIHGGEFCGVISVGDELGYWLGTSFQGRGFMTEAASAVIGDYFEHTDEPLYSGYLTGNSRSRNVLEKLGFDQHGTRLGISRPLAREVTIQKMLLTAERWGARHVA